MDIKEEVLFSKREDDCGLTISSCNFANEVVKRTRVNFRMECEWKYVLLP